MRNVKILRKQIKQLPIRELIPLIGQALFYNEPILVYKLDVSQAARNGFEPIEGVEIEKGHFEDLECAKQTMQPLPWEFQCHDFDGVEDFFVARDANGVQHISWVYFYQHRNRLLSLGESEAEIKFCLTLPGLRGLGIYPRVILLILKYLHSKGMNRVFMCVHPDNQPSIRGIEKAGFTRVAKIRLRKIMGIQVSPRFDTWKVK